MKEFDIELTLADFELEPFVETEVGSSGWTWFLVFAALLVLGMLLYQSMRQEPLRRKTH